MAPFFNSWTAHESASTSSWVLGSAKQASRSPSSRALDLWPNFCPPQRVSGHLGASHGPEKTHQCVASLGNGCLLTGGLLVRVQPGELGRSRTAGGDGRRPRESLTPGERSNRWSQSSFPR